MVEKQADGESKFTKFAASILVMAEEHLKRMEGMSRLARLIHRSCEARLASVA